MSNFVEVIQECESANGAGTKKAIQAALAKADPIAQRLIKEALDPYRVFGVRKFDMPKYSSKCMMTQVDYDALFDVLDKLACRDLTGDAAREAVSQAIAQFPAFAHEYIARIIGKDLKAGFSADTVNKIFPGLVPTFEVMLADKFDTDEEVKQNVKFPCLVEAKYDGERTIAVVTQLGVTYYSRSGKIAEHVNGLFDNDLQDMRATIGQDIVVDGERYASDFTETMNAKKDGNSAAKDNLRFYAFYMMTLSDWKAQQSSMTMEAAREWLNETIIASNCQKVKLSKGRIAVDANDAEAFYHEMVGEKFEGLILKQLDAVYEWDRAKTWIKWKPFFDFDGTVIGFYEGREGTRLQGTLGGIIIRGTDEQGRVIEAKVGSGFNDEMRNEIWTNQAKYLGKTVTVKYQELSLAKNSEIYSLRFPTFEHFRDDK